MTGRGIGDDTLREAFQGLGDGADGACSEEDLDRVWRAVTGELPAAARRELVDRMATDPACAEAWRVANELWRASQGEGLAAPERHVRSWTPSWLGVAAALLVSVSIGLFSWFSLRPADEFRDPGSYAVDSLVPSETFLPRETFRLRWTPGPQGSRYHVRVTTEELRELTTAMDLTDAELVVERDRLASLPPGARVLWQVDVLLPTGERISSMTFVARVQ